MLDWDIEPDIKKYQCDDCEYESNEQDDFQNIAGENDGIKIPFEIIRLCNTCYNTKCEICGSRGSVANRYVIENQYWEKKICPECFFKHKTAKEIAKEYDRTPMQVGRWVKLGLIYVQSKINHKNVRLFTTENVDKFLKTSKYELKGLKK